MIVRPVKLVAMKCVAMKLVTAAVALTCAPAVQGQATGQVAIGRVELMPNEPVPYKLRDWKATARGFDRLAFDFDAKGEYLPLIWWDDTQVNIKTRGFGMTSYVGHPEMKGGNSHEALTVLGSLLGATIAGIDKSRGEHDYISMAAQYFGSAGGLNLVLNRVSAKTGETYWYEIYPQVLFDCLADQYPQEKNLSEIMHRSAEKWNTAFNALKSRPGGLSFDHTAFDFATMQPVDNGKWREPDGAAAIAWIQYMAYRRFGDAKFLEAADGCLNALQTYPVNPSYEVLLPLGALTAARMNAELDRNFDVDRLINWCFAPSETRTGWGVVVGKWGGYECSGLVGSTSDGGGYGFVMNTFANAASLVPLVRYDERYARAIGKWMLNASNSVRLCYPDELPRELQSCPDWKSEPSNVIAYEGLRRQRNGKRPYASGDPISHKWGPSDLGLYGSAFAGVYAGIITPTNDTQILQLDLLATDFFRGDANPSHLLYNPHAQETEVTIKVGAAPRDIYDAVANDFIARGVKDEVQIRIPADSARVIVLSPPDGKLTHDGPRTLIDGVVVDYNNNRVARPAPPARAPVVDRSRAVHIDRATVSVDGDRTDWSTIQSEPIHLDTSGRGSLECDLRLAWDDTHLYALIEETHAGRDTHEAPDAAAYASAPWDFDGVWLDLDLANGRFQSPGNLVLSLALNSHMTADIHLAPEAPEDGSAKIRIATSGTAKAHTRVIEAKIAWRGLIAATLGATHAPDAAENMIKPGFRFGCEPLLVEMNHTRQSHIGGGQYIRPAGTDKNSIDLVLRQAPRQE